MNAGVAYPSLIVFLEVSHSNEYKVKTRVAHILSSIALRLPLSSGALNLIARSLGYQTKKSQNRSRPHSRNPTLANSTREWGTLYMGVAGKAQNGKKAGPPSLRLE